MFLEVRTSPTNEGLAFDLLASLKSVPVASRPLVLSITAF